MVSANEEESDEEKRVVSDGSRVSVFGGCVVGKR